MLKLAQDFISTAQPLAHRKNLFLPLELEKTVDMIEVILDSLLVFTQKGAHLQILLDGKFNKNLSPLRTMNNSFADDLMRGQVVESVALVKNFSFDRNHTRLGYVIASGGARAHASRPNGPRSRA